jgi:hypothetical protein
MDKIVAFYSGMGMLIDGTDISVADAGSLDAVGDSVAIAGSELVSAVGSGTSSISNKLDDMIANGLLVMVDESQLPKLSTEDLVNITGNYLPSINDMVSTLPQLVQSEPKTNNITIHYDNMLKVEGSVDKDALPKLQNILEKSYDYTATRLYKEMRVLK